MHMDAPDPAESGLFPHPSGPGVMAAAMRAQIDQWRRAGKIIGPAIEASLMEQAGAIDMARVARRPTAVSGGNRVLADMLDTYGLVTKDVPPPPDDPLAGLLAALAENDAPAPR